MDADHTAHRGAKTAPAPGSNPPLTAGPPTAAQPVAHHYAGTIYRCGHGDCHRAVQAHCGEDEAIRPSSLASLAKMLADLDGYIERRAAELAAPAIAEAERARDVADQRLPDLQRESGRQIRALDRQLASARRDVVLLQRNWSGDRDKIVAIRTWADSLRELNGIGELQAELLAILNKDFRAPGPVELRAGEEGEP